VNVHSRNGFLKPCQMMLRKIPLGPFIEILQDLFDSGADFIDISGENSDDVELPRDTIKITVKPEYLNDHDENDMLEIEQEIEMDYSGDEDDINISSSKLSDEDIDDLI
jgi:hypothetical protein